MTPASRGLTANLRIPPTLLVTNGLRLPPVGLHRKCASAAESVLTDENVDVFVEDARSIEVVSGIWHNLLRHAREPTPGAEVWVAYGAEAATFDRHSRPSACLRLHAQWACLPPNWASTFEVAAQAVMPGTKKTWLKSEVGCTVRIRKGHGACSLLGRLGLLGDALPAIRALQLRDRLFGQTRQSMGESVPANDRRRLDFVVYGATANGADGAALNVAERRKHSTYPELATGGPQKLLVPGSEIFPRAANSARRGVLWLGNALSCKQLDEKTEEFERLMGGDALLDADSASEVDDAGDAEEQARAREVGVLQAYITALEDKLRKFKKDLAGLTIDSRALAMQMAGVDLPKGTCPHQDKEKCSRGNHRWIRAKANAFVASRLPKPRRHVLFYAQPRDQRILFECLAFANVGAAHIAPRNTRESSVKFTCRAFGGNYTRSRQRPLSMLTKQRILLAVWRRQKVVSSCRPSDDANLDEELWQQTMAECEKGWVSGPYMSEAEVSRVLASDEWLCTKRFPLIQGDKIRLIDDALASGVNAAFSTFNKLKLMDIDTLVSLTTAAALAPGTEDTFAALSDPARRPPALINCPADVRDLQPDAPATLTDAAVGQALRSSRRGTAAGLSGATCEHYKVLLDDAEALELFAHAANLLASAQIPANIAAALAVSRLTALRKPAGESRVALSTGETLNCAVHPSWGKDFNLVGRTLDLSSVYKQLGMKPEAQLVRPLVAWSPQHKQPVFFIASALMFGTTGSVFAFNRAALSLWHLAVSLGKTWITCYFDDFPSVELTRLAGSSRSFLEGLLKALGWSFAETGKKALPYAPVFHALGATLDVSSCGSGKLTVGNKKSRVEELKRDAVRILDAGSISRHEAAAFHGRLNFAQGQLFGCIMKPAMQLLSKWAERRCAKGDAKVLASVMTYIVTVLETAPPRSICVHDRRPPVLIFTDGAFEPEDPHHAVGAGAVIVDDFTKTRPDLPCRKQIIMHLELWPVLVTLLRLGKSLKNRRVLVFIDNNGARDALIKGTSPVDDVFPTGCPDGKCARLLVSRLLGVRGEEPRTPQALQPTVAQAVVELAALSDATLLPLSHAMLLCMTLDGCLAATVQSGLLQAYGGLRLWGMRAEHLKLSLPTQWNFVTEAYRGRHALSASGSSRERRAVPSAMARITAVRKTDGECEG
ncbi:hypothetical protein AK812_SmicGene42573 [Symbiodinium microadriaticum]|uniref:Uncharacterized protein n=1 Tax=Symbiodinium microadriaticum TaxID=2951 RepID=A0A1Q9C370_SYMMI|nr:hypothetical protein AK812_SmicGene42573 [Symbiodinium microadriaticum]